MREFEFLQEKPELSQLDIEGERISLVSISEKFTQDIFREFSIDITTYMFPKPAEAIEETQAFIRSSLEGFRNANNLHLVILNKKTREFLGCCGLHGDSNPSSPELGIWIKKSAHGHGLGKEAIHTLAYWAKSHLKITALTYPVDEHNHASRKIPESLGGKVIARQSDTGMAGNTLNLLIYEIPLPLPAT